MGGVPREESDRPTEENTAKEAGIPEAESSAALAETRAETLTTELEEELELEVDADGVAVVLPVAADEKRPARPRLINPDEELSEARAGQIALKLALPAVAENFLMSLVGMADMIMVGRIGAAATAAVGITNQPIFLATALFQALNVGTTALVARLFGAQDHRQANEAARQTLVLVAIMSVIVSVGLYIFCVPILQLMKAEEDTLHYAVHYFEIVTVSLIFNQIMMAINAQVRGAGDTRTPMINNTATNLINLVLNYLLINGIWFLPRLDVTGAALATAISRFAGMCMALYVVLSGHNNIHISLRERFHFNWDIARRVATVGLPSAIEQLVMRGGNFLFTITVTGLGTVTYAAHVVAMNIQSLSMSPGMGFGMAATTLVGQSLGAKRPDWAEACGWVTQKMSMYLAIPMTLLFFFAGKLVATLYSDDPMVIEQAGAALKIVAITQIPQMSQVVLAGGLRGAGDTKWPLISTAVGIWVFRVALAWVFVYVMGMGLMGAWLSLALDQVARSIIIMYRYRSGHWKTIKV